MLLVEHVMNPKNARYELMQGEHGWYYCWLIEKLTAPEWWGVNGFVTDAHKALWFARREDADEFASEMAADVRVCEHGFEVNGTATTAK